LLPAEKELPPTSSLYDEIEACSKFGGDWARWRALPAMERGMLMAHLDEKNQRDAYERDQLEAAAKKGDQAEAPWDRVSRMFFGDGDGKKKG
jgi:hypothetical protein